MGEAGHKGGMGVPGRTGGPDLPKWVIDIVDFRNKKYNEDCYDVHVGLSKYTLEEVDREYDVIDNAIQGMIKDTLYNITQGCEWWNVPTEHDKI